MEDSNTNLTSSEVRRIVSLELTAEQQQLLQDSLGERQVFSRLHVDELTGAAARKLHPGLVMGRVVVACW